MHWIALGVVCVALVFVSYHSPKIGFGLLASIGVLLAALYFLNPEDSQDANFPIAKESVVLSDMKITASYAGSWTYSGRISNLSEVSITDMRVKIQLYDCPDGATEVSDECVKIGEEVDFVAINVPPRQARDIEDTISLRNAVPKATALWEFELVGLRVAE